MYDYRQFYIDGEWILPSHAASIDVINPATESVIGKISQATETDIDHAVNAAKRAFSTYSLTTPAERLGLLEKLLGIYATQIDQMAAHISDEMGAPITLAQKAQAPCGLAHIANTIDALKQLAFETRHQNYTVAKEPVGVCALITPWNWPINQVACKVIPALAAGCTVVLKPSEIAPLSAFLFARMLHEAGFPKGVFNLINGDGASVGTALSRHPDIDMVSFTGSTRAGIAIAKNAADTVKRVTQELGGKSANIILSDADFSKAVKSGVIGCFQNTGQSCNAPTRMLVPANRIDEAIAIAKAVAEKVVVGDPKDQATTMGPLASSAQFHKVQSMIQEGIAQGANAVVGGLGKPDGLMHGYFVKPTVFAPVDNAMAIAQEEIFGPVLCIIPYDNDDDAIRIANDTPYGLAAYVSGESTHARRIAAHLRVGNVYLNGAGADLNAPFGGYKQSGNGREWGREGLEEYFETKAIIGA